MRLKSIKRSHIILSLVVLSIIIPVITWLATPKKALDIIVLNKTLPIAKKNGNNEETPDYSMHRGIFWIINHLKLKNPSTNSSYNFKTDYYGNLIDSNGQMYTKSLSEIKKVPDIIYLSDTYGTGKSKKNGNEAEGISGFTEAEAALVSAFNLRGTTVIGEYNIAGEPTELNVRKDLENIFNLEFSGWTGKFFSELSSEVDVPDWLRSAYEKRYGKKWKLSGAGLVLVSSSNIIVLQRDIDFDDKSIRIKATEEMSKKFNTSTEINYYNWFDIVKPKSGASVLAWYDLNLTESGNKQIQTLGLQNSFPAVIYNGSGSGSAYYLAGNFSEYREPWKMNFFYGASWLYKKFSLDNEGDYSYFYWNFYNPLISEILSTERTVNNYSSLTAIGLDNGKGTTLVSKASEGKFSVYKNDKWNDLFVKGVDIGSTFPGEKEGFFPKDNSVYRDWFEKLGDLNVNAIRVYTLMPPGFYNALDEYNMTHQDKLLYLFQNIATNQHPKDGNYLDIEYSESFKQSVIDTIDAMHGNLKIENKDTESNSVYTSDISGYILGYLVDADLNTSNVKATDILTPAFKFTGDYVSSGKNSTNTEAWLASICDEVYKYEQSNYKMQHPTAFVSIPELDTLYHDRSDADGMADMVSVDINNLDTSTRVYSGFFGAYNIFPDHPGFMTETNNNESDKFEGYRKYIKEFMATQKKYPVLVSEFGLSTSRSLSDTTVDAEEEQGRGIISMMDIIKESGCAGGLIYQWNDDWGKSGKLNIPLVIPYDRNTLWHNTTDPEQNYGIMAVRAETPKKNAMTLKAHAPLKTLAYAANESFFYITAVFDSIPNLKEKDIVLYLDTVDRNKGEYLLAPNVPETWTGSEFSIRIKDEQTADLLVIPEYNSSKGSYYTKVKSEGTFERMIRMTSKGYKTKSGEIIASQYEDLSRLIPGSFDNTSSNFSFEGTILYIRIPWSKLNFTDPSNSMVLDDSDFSGILENEVNRLKVRMTDGIVTSLIIMDKTTNAVDYHFPESVYSTGYRTFSWKSWDAPTYITTNKKSYEILKRYFENK